MGKRGPASSAPGGYGTISNGYRRMYDSNRRRMMMEHDMVWEAVHGPIQTGWEVHLTHRQFFFLCCLAWTTIPM